LWYPRTAVLPPVTWARNIGFANAVAAPASSIRTRAQSIISSSATICGSAELVPWPISLFGATIVTVSSGLMRT